MFYEIQSNEKTQDLCFLCYSDYMFVSVIPTGAQGLSSQKYTTIQFSCVNYVVLKGTMKSWILNPGLLHANHVVRLLSFY